MMTRQLAILFGVTACAAAVLAQSQKFEVASVKPNTSGNRGAQISIQPGGRYTATNVPLRMLILSSYRLQGFQLVGAPDWIDSEHFDITAKADVDFAPPAPGGPPSAHQMMMRALLEERFHLAVHQETRDMPIYALVLARPDGAAPQRKPSTVNCDDVAAARRGGGPSQEPSRGVRGGGAGAALPCGMRMGPGQLSASGFPISQLAQALSQWVGRVVVDRTGLTGNYDFELSWSPDQGPEARDVTGASIFTALQEQLGLKLESTRGPVEVTVIDHVERPTPD